MNDEQSERQKEVLCKEVYLSVLSLIERYSVFVPLGFESAAPKSNQTTKTKTATPITNKVLTVGGGSRVCHICCVLFVFDHYHGATFFVSSLCGRYGRRKREETVDGWTETWRGSVRRCARTASR